MEEFQLPSADGATSLHGVLWLPEEPPIGVVQLIHGMAEYIQRYHSFALYLNRLGYVVVGHDHLGHGQSVNPENPHYGYFGEASTTAVLADIQQVREWTERRHPELPYFILGHSMGSFALRNYLQQTQNELAGVILMGTGSKPVLLSIAQPFIQRLSEKDGQKVNPIIDKLAFGSFSRAFPEPSPFNWISKNQENVVAYEADHLTGFVFTNNGFHTLFQLVEGANRKGWANRLSRNLPVLLVSGEQDPVGDFGKGPTRVAAELKRAGLQDVSLVLYPELRHEILMETEKDKVYTTIGTWIQKHT